MVIPPMEKLNSLLSWTESGAVFQKCSRNGLARENDRVIERKLFICAQRLVQQIVGRERRGRLSQLAWCGGGCFESRRRVNSTVMRHESVGLPKRCQCLRRYKLLIAARYRVRSSLCQNYHRPIRSSLFKVRPYCMSPMSSRRQHSIETCSGLCGTLATNHTLSSGATTQRSTSLKTMRVPRASTYFNG